MSVIYKVITRPTDPRVPNSPKRFYPHLITLGQSVSLKYLAEKMRDRSSLSVGDIERLRGSSITSRTMRTSLASDRLCA